MRSLRKSKHILCHLHRLYLKKKKTLPAAQKEEVRASLAALQEAVMHKDRAKADFLSRQAESLQKEALKKNGFEQLRDLIFSLGFALFVAILVRMMWFEFYEIPSGSMRPTLKEQDRLVVSKTDFGINIPMTTEHLYFDPSLVQRSSIFIFTGENMDIRDVDTMYFYLFPGKKQFVKRLLGKPGDTLYFYGGRVYGIDQEGKDISSQLQPVELDHIDHIPFIHFEGKVAAMRSPQNGIFSPIVLYQMNEPIAKLSMNSRNQPEGEMLSVSPVVPKVPSFGDLWGFKHYAMARLLTKEEVKQLTDFDLSQMEEGALYLELKHHPSISSLKLACDALGRLRPTLSLSSSLIPLKEENLNKLFNNLYTARFRVDHGYASRYGANYQAHHLSFLPKLNNVPDGMYEIQGGKAYEVKWQGIVKELPSSHPLCHYSPQLLQLLFNVGIEFDMRFAPQTKNQPLQPARYAYYREGDLYVLGAPLLSKGDPTLLTFLEKEQERKKSAPPQYPYSPFEDLGPPLKADGALDVGLVRAFGLTLPPKSYLALGDNHAMSGDSRDFGFVPEGNIRGGPDFIFWPVGSRFGRLNQPPYPWINLPRTIIWVAAATCLGTWALVHRRRTRLPLNLD